MELDCDGQEEKETWTDLCPAQLSDQSICVLTLLISKFPKAHYLLTSHMTPQWSCMVPHAPFWSCMVHLAPSNVPQWTLTALIVHTCILYLYYLTLPESFLSNQMAVYNLFDQP